MDAPDNIGAIIQRAIRLAAVKWTAGWPGGRPSLHIYGRSGFKVIPRQCHHSCIYKQPSPRSWLCFIKMQMQHRFMAWSLVSMRQWTRQELGLWCVFFFLLLPMHLCRWHGNSAAPQGWEVLCTYPTPAKASREQLWQQRGVCSSSL